MRAQLLNNVSIVKPVNEHFRKESSTMRAQFTVTE